jgi:anaerobic magnesium-protoporphyrin IX monomethyl ester cyclase
MNKRKVLLLNPPGDRLYLRDCYCSHVSKASYYWHPFDLVVQSGILDQQHDVTVLDAAVLGLTISKTLEYAAKTDADMLLFLTGSVSWRQDFLLIKDILKSNSKIKTVVATGDIVLMSPSAIIQKNRFIDAVLSDFTVDGLLTFLGDKAEPGMQIPGVSYRLGDQIIESTQAEANEFELPFQRLELFPWKKYRIPHGRRSHFASVITSFGCPFKCSYCIGSILAPKFREPENAADEIAYLHESFGIREYLVKDLTFAASRPHAEMFLEALMKKKMNIEWLCLSRTDVLDEELLDRMARAGCHTIQFGVESASRDILENVNRKTDHDTAKRIFTYCRKKGIRTLAHFIIGLPGETEETFRETMNLAVCLNPDFASFNPATLKWNSPFRELSQKKGWVKPDVLSAEDDEEALLTSDGMDSGLLDKWYRSAIRDFYLRPEYIKMKLTGIKTFHEFKNDLFYGCRLLTYRNRQ